MVKINIKHWACKFIIIIIIIIIIILFGVGWGGIYFLFRATVIQLIPFQLERTQSPKYTWCTVSSFCANNSTDKVFFCHAQITTVRERRSLWKNSKLTCVASVPMVISCSLKNTALSAPRLTSLGTPLWHKKIDSRIGITT